jgi:hypothetical protein
MGLFSRLFPLKKPAAVGHGTSLTPAITPIVNSGNEFLVFEIFHE